MGGTFSNTGTTRVDPATRAANIRAATASTVSRLQHPQLKESLAAAAGAAQVPAPGPTNALSTLFAPQSVADCSAVMLGRAQACAARGGAALIKHEIVHLAVILETIIGVVPTGNVYAALESRGLDELYTLLRMQMFAPQMLEYLASKAHGGHGAGPTAPPPCPVYVWEPPSAIVPPPPAPEYAPLPPTPSFTFEAPAFVPPPRIKIPV